MDRGFARLRGTRDAGRATRDATNDARDANARLTTRSRVYATQT
jgi:hypothetical protein